MEQKLLTMVKVMEAFEECGIDINALYMMAMSIKAGKVLQEMNGADTDGFVTFNLHALTDRA